MYRLTAFFRTMKTGSSPSTIWSWLPAAIGSRSRITADQKDIVVQAGESVRFQGDTTHAYRNISDQTTILHMILYNP